MDGGPPLRFKGTSFRKRHPCGTSSLRWYFRTDMYYLKKKNEAKRCLEEKPISVTDSQYTENCDPLALTPLDSHPQAHVATSPTNKYVQAL